MIMDKRLYLLFSGQILAGLGSGVFDFALIWYALGSTESITDVGFVIFLRFIPYAVFGVIGGWVGDRWDRRLIIIWADVFRAVVITTAALLTLASVDLVAILALSAFLLTIARTLFQPAIQGLLPSLCGPSGLARANAAHHGIREVLGIVAPLAGSVLLSFLPVQYVFGCIAALFAGGALCTACVPAVATERRPHAGLLSEYRDLIRYINKDQVRVKYALILNVTAVVGIAGVLSLLLPAHIKELYPDSPERLGIFMGLMACGTLAGALLVGWLNTSSELGAMYLGWLGYGALILLFALPWTFVALLAIGAILGAVGAAPDILFATAVQKRMPDHKLSKTFALFSTFANLGEALSAPFLAFIVATQGLRTAFVIGGACAILSAIVGFYTLALRNVNAGDRVEHPPVP